MEGGFTSYNERIDARKVRARSKSFMDHFSQATLFYNSQSRAEKDHLTDALRFELSKVQTPAIRERMVGLLTQVDRVLAKNVADALGLALPKAPEQPMNHGVPADADPKTYQPVKAKSQVESSEPLSMQNTIKNTVKSRCVAILAADGVDDAALNKMKAALIKEGAQVKVIAPKLGFITGTSGAQIACDESFLIATSVVYDAVYIPGGDKSIKALTAEANALHFVNEAYRHCKAIAADKGATGFIAATYIAGTKEHDHTAALGVVLNGNVKEFIQSIAQHRFWEREILSKVPA